MARDLEEGALDQRLDGELLHRIQGHGLFLLRLRRGFCRDLGVDLGCCAHHVADTRGCAQDKKHNQKDRAGMKTEMAEQPVDAPSKSAPDDQCRNQFGCETARDARLRRRRAFRSCRVPFLGLVHRLPRSVSLSGSGPSKPSPGKSENRAKRAFQRVEGGRTIGLAILGVKKDRQRQIPDTKGKNRGRGKTPSGFEALAAESLRRDLFRIRQAHRHQLADAALRHGDAEQPVHPAHGQGMVGDDQEAGTRHLGHLGQHLAETLDIGVVQRRVHFVQHADRGRVHQEHREDQRHGGQRLFAARQQRQRLQPLARRAGEDLQTCFQRVFGFGEGELGFSAFEQLGEKFLEVGVDLFERGQQTLAAFLVQALDAAAQAGR